jgi:hypothetical protein
MAYNNRDIAVALTVAGFIDPDLRNAVQTDIHVRFEIFMDTCDTSADGTPVDPHIFGDGTAAEILSHPGDRIIEVFGKVRVRECPWYISGLDAMFLAADAWEISLNIDKDPSEIQCPPTFMLIRGIIDPGVTLTTYGAFPLQALAQMYFHKDT